MLGTLFRFTGVVILICIMAVAGSILLSSYILEVPVAEVILLLFDDILKLNFT